MRNLAPFTRRPLALTPLIDVIFLLLLFFMLTSTFSTYGEIELSHARKGSGSSEATVERAFVQLGQERVTLNGQSVAMEDVIAKVEDGQLLVSLDEGTTAQRLVDFLHLMRARSGLDVLVLE
ncbi:biopolymer transporter ExbD [Shimia haliotis]|uniref:Outer membrane transport energization protein ExbD n=1 Tax=Shimia haliotis TaxID=1280847 RepID=A0A1I4DM76_9RHOB|nr:biopolymer transporter ExbD [Shimia haliotis]SFK94702.1 outer membrane transport energization protein ExbD [Shimia haliotis]